MNLLRCMVLILIAAQPAIAAQLPRIPVWRQVELPLTTATQHKNPFTDVTVTGTFIGPGGAKIVVDGFHNGGNSWRVRFMPTQEGVWSYSTLSSDKSMPALKGKFQCVPWDTPGPVFVDKANPTRFAHASGAPFLYNGVRCMILFGLPEHTPQLPFGGWQAFVDSTQRLGFNSIMVTPYFTKRSASQPGQTNESMPDQATVWPDNSSPTRAGDLTKPIRIDFDRFYLPQWKKMDKIITYMAKKNIIAYIVLHPGGLPRVHNTAMFREPSGLSVKQERMYLRYAVARLASHANIQWCLAWNYTKYRDTRWAKKTGKLLREIDPYGHPITIHGDAGFRLGKEKWQDFLCFTGKADDAKTLDKAAKLGKPIINNDYGSESRETRSADAIRLANWSLALAGAHGTYGNVEAMSGDFRNSAKTSPGAAAIGVLNATLAQLPWHEMRPNSKVVKRGALCLAKPGEAYIVYFRKGGETALDLTAVKEPMLVTRVNPRTGERKEFPQTVPGKRLKLKAPSLQDWAFVVTAPPKEEPEDATKQ